MRTHCKLMPRIAAAAGTFAILSAGPVAIAQDSGLQEFRAACELDYKHYCTGDDPGAAVEAACLSQYYINLSLSCRAALGRQQNPAAAEEDQSGSSDENGP